MNTPTRNIPYHPFETFVFRTPHVCFQEFERHLRRLETDESYWQEFLQDRLLQEAIYLGTPVLYDEIQKFLAGTLTAPKEVRRLKLSVLRYYTRMSTRSTPFGLFAGFSLGHFGSETSITLGDTGKYSRRTRLDMNYLCSLAQDIGTLPDAREHLCYFPNSTIHALGDKLRYVEYYYKNARRVHNISAVDNSEYLTAVLQQARAGCKMEALAAPLTGDDTTLEEAMGFIHELIDSQLLISELEPAVTGTDFLAQLLAVLPSIPGMEEKSKILTQIAALLSAVDSSVIGTTLLSYRAIEEMIKELGTTYEARFLFQTDMFKPVNKAVIDKKLIQSVRDALVLMNKLTVTQTESLLSKFAEEYYERYEDRELPLLEALDVESGIGYGQGSGDISPLLAGYVFPFRKPGNVDIKWNRIQSVLHGKFLEAYKEHAYTVIIEETDFDFLQPNWEDLPATMSGMCEIFCYEGETPLVYLHRTGGSSAANLLGRFCHVSRELENYTKEITAFEQSQNPDVLYAEVVHLPESRIGNILLRPVLREYEIPYLGRSSVKPEFQIPLSDLYVSVRGKSIFLRSKRLNKEVIPRLSTAHNYAYNSMPVYHFLCDMQIQGLRSGIGFDWGSLANEYAFLPRVMYKNVILSPARWTIKTNDFIKLSQTAMSDLKEWRDKKQLPRYAVLPDGDNALFVDMENSLSIHTLLSVIKKRPSFPLEEFPFDVGRAVVRNKMGEAYTNEFIFGFYKSQKV